MSNNSSTEAAAVYLASGAFLMAGSFRMIFVGAEVSSLVGGGALLFLGASLLYLGCRRLMGRVSEPQHVRPAKTSTALNPETSRERRNRTDRRERVDRRRVDMPVAVDRRQSRDRRRMSDRRYLRPVPRIVSWDMFDRAS